jgi:hypothetical protein
MYYQCGKLGEDGSNYLFGTLENQGQNLFTSQWVFSREEYIGLLGRCLED